MAIGYGVAQPKPEPLKKTKARKDREDAKRLTAFRGAVWEREARRWPELPHTWGWQWARCQACGGEVFRTFHAMTGEVHHRIGRRAKATRYVPDNGVLLCNALVNDCHRKAQEHLITLSAVVQTYRRRP